MSGLGMNSRKRKEPVADSKNEAEINTNTVYDNFKQGDVLFGLVDERYEVDKKLKTSNYHHTVANRLNSPAVDKIIKGKESAEDLAELDAEQKTHYQLLLKHKDYLTKQPGKPIQTISEPIASAAYRRACKLLLINRDPERTYNAHFITNNVFWKRVCAKTDNGVTNSELRAAYRDYLKNGRNPHIFFYDSNHKQMQRLPWEQEQFKHHWNEYNKTRENKK